MSELLTIGDLSIEVVKKDIKNIHLTVNPPDGRVRIAAPERMQMEAIRLFTISKLSWIRKQQQRLRDQERETAREFLDRESHYVWGKRYLLQVVDLEAAPKVEIKHSKLVLHIRPGADEASRDEALALWYRQTLKAAAMPLIETWKQGLGVDVVGFYVQKMKTRWGSCNPLVHTIRLNTELAKKPRECLEYVVVHEMVHILEPSHNLRFQSIMDGAMPAWRDIRDLLNRLPARHERWGY